MVRTHSKVLSCESGLLCGCILFLGVAATCPLVRWAACWWLLCFGTVSGFFFVCGNEAFVRRERLWTTCIGCGGALRVAPSFNKASIAITFMVSMLRLNPSLGSMFALAELVDDSICSLHSLNVSCALSCNCGLAAQVVKYKACGAVST